MGKKKKSHDMEEEAELWLISYADMMTLIACFFILMMAFANYDPVGFQKKVEQIAESFNKDKYKSSATPLTELTEEIAKHPELKDLTKVTINDSEMAITFSGTIVFAKGGHEITDDISVILDSLIDLIKSKDPNYLIVVEGHTDGLPPQKKGFFKSNWALSGARAAAVVERFEYFGFNPQSLRAIGLGDTQPLVPNTDDNGNPIIENLQLNRRVVIKVIEPRKSLRKVKMGLGVYFD